MVWTLALTIAGCGNIPSTDQEEREETNETATHQPSSEPSTPTIPSPSLSEWQAAIDNSVAWEIPEEITEEDKQLVDDILDEILSSLDDS